MKAGKHVIGMDFGVYFVNRFSSKVRLLALRVQVAFLKSNLGGTTDIIHHSSLFTGGMVFFYFSVSYNPVIQTLFLNFKEDLL